jgi:hypothetical protein
LAVVGVGILAKFSLDFVNENLKEAGNCFDAVDKLKINDDFTCIYDNVSDRFAYIQVETKDLELEEFLITLSGENGIVGVPIKGGAVSNLDLHLKNDNPPYDSLAVPEPNNGRTYSIRTSYGKYNISEIQMVRVSAVFDGKTCESVDEINIYSCLP